MALYAWFKTGLETPHSVIPTRDGERSDAEGRRNLLS
jgi:hypothetical protein